jgi:hypothetical protein
MAHTERPGVSELSVPNYIKRWHLLLRDTFMENSKAYTVFSPEEARWNIQYQQLKMWLRTIAILGLSSLSSHGTELREVTCISRLWVLTSINIPIFFDKTARTLQARIRRAVIDRYWISVVVPYFMNVRSAIVRTFLKWVWFQLI